MSQLINYNEEKPSSRLSFGLDFGGSLMLFGYTFDFCFDLFEWHFKVSEIWPVLIGFWIGPFYCGISDDTIKILETDERDKELANLNKTILGLEHKLAFEKDETEQLRVKLAGCAVAAEGYGENLAPGTYGHSNSYDEVRLLYVKYRQALKLIEKIRGKKEPPKRSHKAKAK